MKIRDITILDLGGRPGYWRNVGLDNIARIELLNIEAAELMRNRAAALFDRKLPCANETSMAQRPNRSAGRTVSRCSVRMSHAHAAIMRSTMPQ